MDAAYIRNIALSFPEATEVSHWGKPSFRVRNKIFAVLQEDGVTLTLKTTAEERDMYTTAQPAIYRIPESFANLNYMHVDIGAADPEEVEPLLLRSWSLVAPKKLVKDYASGREMQ